MHVYMVLNMVCFGLLISVVLYMLALLAIFLQTFFLFKKVLVPAGLKLVLSCEHRPAEWKFEITFYQAVLSFD